MPALSLSLREMKTPPERGSFTPAPSSALAKAASNRVSMPITSPVERISGPSTGSTPGKRVQGITASLTEICLGAGSFSPNSFSLAPAITFAAILATGWPIALATKGTVREARGLTSRT